VGGRVGGRVAAIVVDYDAGEVLARCVSSLLDDAEVAEVVVVANGDPVATTTVLRKAGFDVPVVAPGRNLGYGGGANRGAAAAGPCEHLLVCNPDIVAHPGAVGRLARTLDAEPAWAIVGPRILTPAGDRYPSVRRFPSMTEAVGHAVLGSLAPGNRFTRRYRSPATSPEQAGTADWVSGACFLVRRTAFEALGGFDEAYFMFAEDMDLCWRACRAGWGVGHQPEAVVTHLQGVSTRRHPYRMLVEHHRSALRFALRSTEGWRRSALPLGAALLGARLVVAVAAQALRRAGPRGPLPPADAVTPDPAPRSGPGRR